MKDLVLFFFEKLSIKLVLFEIASFFLNLFLNFYKGFEIEYLKDKSIKDAVN